MNIFTLRTDLSTKLLGLLALAALILSSVPVGAMTAQAARTGVTASALSGTTTEVGVPLRFQAQVQDDGSDNETASITLSDDSATGTFFDAEATSCTADEGANPSVTVNSNWIDKNFCYTNAVAGTYTISVQLSTGTVDVGPPATVVVTVTEPESGDSAPVLDSVSPAAGAVDSTPWLCGPFTENPTTAVEGSCEPTDDTMPDVVIISHAEGDYVRGDTTFEARITDDSALASYVFRLRFLPEEGGQVTAMTFGGTVTVNEEAADNLYAKSWDSRVDALRVFIDEYGEAGRLPDGTYRIDVFATDVAGNEARQATGGGDQVEFYVDNTAPAIPTGLTWTDSNSNLVPNNGTTELVSGTASWNQNTEEDFSRYLYKIWNDIEGSPYQGSDSAWTTDLAGVGNTSRSGAFGQGEGTYHYCVAAVDVTGNQSDCSSVFTVTYEIPEGSGGDEVPVTDTVNPVVEITNLVVSNDKKLSFDLTATDDRSGLEIVGANIYNENNSGNILVPIGRLNVPSAGLPSGTLTFSTSTSDIDVSGLADGTYTLRVIARDHAGNEHRFLLVAFDIVTAEPDSPETTPQLGGSGPVLTGSNDLPVSAVLGVSTSAPEGEVLGASTSSDQCVMYIQEYMNMGSTPSMWEVLKLQLFLASKSLFTGEVGIFGEGTAAAVRSYQTAHADAILQPWVDAGLAEAGFTANGNVYKTTRWHINNAVCAGSESFPLLP